MKVSQATVGYPSHVIVYGDGGTGKSTLVSKLTEQGFKLLWLSVDNGHGILQKLTPAQQDLVELVVIPDTRDYPVGVDAFRESFKYGDVHICNIHGKHKCTVCATDPAAIFTDYNLRKLDRSWILVLDNLSQISDSYQSLVCKGKPVDYKLQLDDWGSLLFHLKKGLGDIQQAPFNICAIAHATDEKNTAGESKIMPLVGSSSFAPKVIGYFDHAVYCKVINKKHAYGSSTGYAINVLTKSRTDVKIESLDKPSLAPFFLPPFTKG